MQLFFLRIIRKAYSLVPKDFSHFLWYGKMERFISFGLGYHQVRVEYHLGVGAEGLNNHLPEGNIGNEYAVHYVKMKKLNSAIFQYFKLGGGVAEIRAQS